MFENFINKETFPFIDLPLVVKDIIVSKVVHDPYFYEFTEFATVSQECNWLVKRARPRKFVDDLRIEPFPDGYKVFIQDKDMKIGSIEQMMCLLNQIRVRKLLVHYNFCSETNMGYFSALHEYYKDACAYARKLVIIKSAPDENILHLIRDLTYCFDFKVRAHIIDMDLTLRMLDAFNKMEDLGLYGYMTELILHYIARRSFPLKPIRRLYIVSWNNYNLQDVKQFIEKTMFLDGAWIKLSINATEEEIMNMFNNIGDYLFMSSKPGEFGFLLRNGIHIYKGSNPSEEHLGVYFTVKNM